MKSVYSIILKEPLYLYCPIIKAEMSIISQEVSELGLFSKVLIWAFGKKYNALQISEITSLPLLIIEDEINYLIKIGILENVNQGQRLTELGYSYFKKVVAVEDFNDRKIQVLINSVSGEIVEESLNIVERYQLKSDEFILSQRIIPELYGNLNPSNSKNFLLEKYDLSPLSSEERSLLDVSIKLQFEKDKKQLIRYKVQKVPFLLHIGTVNSMYNVNLTSRKETIKYDETHSLLPLMYPIQKGKLVIKNQDLEPYRNILSTLEKIEQFDRELLSDKSNYLLDLYMNEQKFQKLLSLDIYFDSVSGILTTSLDPQYRLEKNIRNEILVPPNYDVEKLLADDFQNIIRNLTDEKVESTSWNIKFVLEEEFYLKVNDNPLSVLTN